MNTARFPALGASDWARFDGPGGSQMVDTAIDAMAEWMRSGDGANLHGAFAAAVATEALVARARVAVGRLLAADPGGVIFGPSMTALTWRLADAVAETLRAGDEIVCTRLDHDANVAPWLAAAARAGATVRFAEVDIETAELSVEAVAAVLGSRTRWVAVSAASNLVGTVTDLPAIIEVAHAAGARVAVDAVHAVPHRRVDVTRLGCDSLACSAYKWFGPHVGALWLAPELMAGLRPAKVRPAPDSGPERWEQGTLPFEALAGAAAAADYLLDTGHDAVRLHEERLLGRMLDGLEAMPHVRLAGAPRDRTPTVFFAVDGLSAGAVAGRLADRRVAVGDGDFYAVELARTLGISDGVRAGALHYTSDMDVDRLLEALATVVDRGH
ncbi:MAG TPA: cysteine desulfurase-like protein [Candidatus Dormibacteraeota bacterium]